MATTKFYWTGAKKAPAQDRFFIEALDPDLWKAGDKNNWDASWHTGMPAPSVLKATKPGKVINHIPGNNALTVKSLLFSTLDGARRYAPVALRDKLGFFPHSYLMPDDYHALQSAGAANPQKKWIVKPKRLSRGRGIEVLDDAAFAPLDEKWLVQDYLAKPHLWNERKYVIRSYVLISSIEPLRTYLYADGFIKLASEPYDGDNFDNLYAHLTNPDVNALNETAAAPVVFYSFRQYADWLAGANEDARSVFDGIREIAAIATIAAREQMRKRTAAAGAYAPGCFELIGLDCMVDGALKPWLLECNLSPSLDICAAREHGGAHEEQTKRELVCDLVNLLDLNNPERHIWRDETDSELIAASERERERAGRFELIFPSNDANELAPFFPVPRHKDKVLIKSVDRSTPPNFPLRAREGSECMIADELALFSPRSQTFSFPDPLNAFIWLNAATGADPKTIADLLSKLPANTDAGATPGEGFYRFVQDRVAQWAADGLLIMRNGPQDGWHGAESGDDGAHANLIDWAGKTIAITHHCAAITKRIEPVLAPLRRENGEAQHKISLMRAAPGYGLAFDERLSDGKIKLSRIADALVSVLLDFNARTRREEICLNASFLDDAQSGALLFANHEAGNHASLAMHYRDISKAVFRGGHTFVCPADGEAAPAPTPARIPKDAGRAYVDTVLHEFESGAPGHLVACAQRGAQIKRQSISAVIIPYYDQQIGANPLIEDTTASARLLLLNSIREKRGGEHALFKPDQFAAWAESMTAYKVRFGDPHAGAEALIATLGVNSAET